MQKQWFTKKERAKPIGSGRATIYRWVRLGGLPKSANRSAACARWRINDLEQWGSERKTGSAK